MDPFRTCLIILSTWTHACMAQTSIIQQALDYSPLGNQMRGITATSDLGVLLDVNVNSTPSLIRLDASLSPVWQKNIPPQSSIAASPNGGAVISYLDALELWLPDSGNAVYGISELNANGVEISTWNVRIELWYEDIWNTFWHNIAVRDDGRVYLAFTSDSDDGLTYLSAIDSDGTLAWSKRVEGMTNTTMAVTGTGGCVITGRSSSGTGAPLKIASFDADGSMEYYRSYDLGITYPTNSTRSQWHNDHLYIFLDNIGSIGYMIADVMGNVQEIHFYGLVPPAPTGTPLGLWSGSVTTNGSIELFGAYAGTSSKSLIFSIDPTGELISTTQFKTTEVNNVRRGYGFEGVDHGNNGSWVLGGYFEQDLIFSQTTSTPYVWAVPVGEAPLLCGAEPIDAAHMVYPMQQLNVTDHSTITDRPGSSGEDPSPLSDISPITSYSFCSVLGLQSEEGLASELFTLINSYISIDGTIQLQCNEPLELEIYDLSGRRCWRTSLLNKELIALSVDLSMGQYVLRGVTADGKIQVAKVTLGHF